MEIKYTYVNVYCHHSEKELTIEEIKKAPSTLVRIVDVNKKNFKSIFDIPEDRIRATVVAMFDEAVFDLSKTYGSFYVSVSCGKEERWV